MAKVTGPLNSWGASGKIANSIVFFPWKGLNVVRQWLKPANPMTGKQGDQRLFLGGTGRAAKPVQEDSYYIGECRSVAVAGQTWISALVGYIIKNKFADATAFEAEVTAYEAHAEKAKFDSEAATLGLVEFTVAYKSTAEVYAAGLMLYVLALYGVSIYTSDNTKFNKVPYTVAIGSWSSANIDSMIVDLAPE